VELRRLRYFCAVVEERHLGRAAQALGVRSTSLSQQIRVLERELSAVLFVRTPAGMVPTTAALEFLPHAEAVLAAAERARESVRGPGSLRVGVTPGSPDRLARRLFAAARSHGTGLVVVDEQTAGQLAALSRGDLDAGVAVLPVDAPGCRVVVVSDAALGVVVAAGHRLAGRDEVGWGDLSGSALLWFARELAPGYHDDVLDACRDAGWVPAQVRPRPPRRSLFVAELGGGDDVVALRPAGDAHAEHGLCWIPLAGPAPRLRHALVWRASHPRAPLLAALAADLRREAAPHARPAQPRGPE
jgi:DNA-binding transcriptional LysR family regulator